jgi:hypothetical protein
MLTLDDIVNAPSDPVALNQHLQQRGLIPLPPPPAQGLPPATIPPMTPIVPHTNVAPMIPPSNMGPSESLRSENNSRGLATLQPPHAPSLAAPPSTAPEIAPMATPAPSTGDLDIKPLVPPNLTHAEKMALPSTSAGVPIGGSAFTENQLDRLQEEKEHPWGSPDNHPGLLGKIGHGLARAGEIAADVVAPGLTQAIPGTPEQRGVQANALKRELAQRTAAEGQAAQRASQEKNVESEIAGRDVQTEEGKARLAKEQTEQSLEKDAQGNVTGWKGPDGKLHSLDEEGTPQAIKDIAEASKSKQGPQLEKTANGDIVQVTTDKDGKAHSEVVYHGDPKVETDLTSKTVNGQEHRILVNKNTGETIKDLGAFKTEETPGQREKAEEAGQEPVIGYDKDGTQRLMSRAEAKQAGLNHIIKATPKDRDDAEQNASALNDMTAKVRNLRESSKAIDKLGTVQKTLIQAALRGGPDDMSTRLAVSQMSPEAKQFYQDVASLREAALALPKQTTGGARVSEVQAHALWSTIPGSAGDHNFRDSQLRKFDENTERLWRKVPAIEGNKRERAFDENEGGKQAGPPGPPDPGMKWQQNKKTGEYRQVKATP